MRSRLVAVLVSAGLLVAFVVGAHGVGYRLNVQTRPVAVPSSDVTPGAVVVAYLDAWNARDFDTVPWQIVDQGFV